MDLPKGVAHLFQYNTLQPSPYAHDLTPQQLKGMRLLVLRYVFSALKVKPKSKAVSASFNSHRDQVLNLELKLTMQWLFHLKAMLTLSDQSHEFTELYCAINWLTYVDHRKEMTHTIIKVQWAANVIYLGNDKNEASRLHRKYSGSDLTIVPLDTEIK